MVRLTTTLRQAAHAVSRTPHPALTLSPAVRSSLNPTSKAPIVALESTIITHGLPYPYNLEVAQELEQVVLDHGAVPATIALLDGKPLVGLEQLQLKRLAQCALDPSKNQAIKASRRDIAHVLAMGSGTVGGTTVSGTMVLAHMAGIPIFATGGIGGVHRGAESTMDISADLTELGRTPVAVFCSGPKSILDIPRTLEVLETFGVSVTTFNPSGEFPAFYTSNSGLHVPYAGSDTQAAAAIFSNAQLGLQSGQVFANPIPSEWNEVGARIQACVEQAVRESIELGINKKGKEVTPWLLKRLAELISESKESNRALVVNNAKKAAQVAVELNRIERDVKQAENTHALGGVRSTSAFGKASILMFGAAAVDIASQVRSADGTSKLASTTYPGRVSVTLGGVARNMAETATRILSPLYSSRSASPVKLVTPIGDDDFGQLLRTGMDQAGMRTDGLFLADGKARTAVCSLMLDDTGDLISGVADMDITQAALYPTSRFDNLVSLMESEQPDIVAFDGNIGSQLAGQLLSACQAYSQSPNVAKRRKPMTLFEPTSVSKSKVILSHYRECAKGERAAITFATPNALELDQFYSTSVEHGILQPAPHKASAPISNTLFSFVDPSTLAKARALVDSDIISCVLLKVGRHGVITIDAARTQHHPVPVGDVEVVNTTGCGDSFVGAFTAALFHLLSHKDAATLERGSSEWDSIVDYAVRVGQLAARDTLASTKAVGEGMHLLLSDCD